MAVKGHQQRHDLDGPDHVSEGWAVEPDVVVGDLVYVQVNGRLAKADRDQLATSQTLIGAVVRLMGDQTCWMKSSGRLPYYTGLTLGARYLLGNGGLITTSAAGQIVRHVGFAISATELQLAISPTLIIRAL